MNRLLLSPYRAAVPFGGGDRGGNRGVRDDETDLPT
jgi:hypothetical protein